jgi:hypothetical protein
MQVSTPDAALLRLIASYITAVEVAERNLAIARALAAGYRSGVHPPEVVLEAYLTRFDADDAQLKHLRDTAAQLKNALTTDN